MILQYRKYTQPFKCLFVTLNMELIYMSSIGICIGSFGGCRDVWPEGMSHQLNIDYVQL